jgi:hypothetical protein
MVVIVTFYIHIHKTDLWLAKTSWFLYFQVKRNNQLIPRLYTVKPMIISFSHVNLTHSTFKEKSLHTECPIVHKRMHKIMCYWLIRFYSFPPFHIIIIHFKKKVKIKHVLSVIKGTVPIQKVHPPQIDYDAQQLQIFVRSNRLVGSPIQVPILFAQINNPLLLLRVLSCWQMRKTQPTIIPRQSVLSTKHLTPYHIYIENRIFSISL